MQNVSGRTLVGLRFWNQARPFLFSSVVFVVQTCLQVDEDGESYWVFESRDVRSPIIPMSRLLIIVSLPDRPTLWIQGIFFIASPFACDNKYLSCRMFWV